MIVLAIADFKFGRARLHRTRWICRDLLLGLAFLNIATAAAQVHKPSEYEVKAAYLYSFGKFVKWPSSVSQNDSFVVCVLGNDPFGTTLDSLVNGEMIDGKRLSTSRVNTPADAGKCRVLFIGVKEASRMSSILSDLHRTPVLTVSDAPDFVERGGMLQFVMREDKVRFLVNLGAAEKVGLTLSSELLKVAVGVKRNQGAGD